MTVASLIDRIAGDMEHSPLDYRFTSSSNEDGYASHEVLPLQPLEFVNKGKIHKDGTVRLQRAGFTAENTIGEFFYDRRRFAFTAHALEENHFILNLSKFHNSLNRDNFELILFSSCTGVSIHCHDRFTCPWRIFSSPYLHLP